MMLALPPRRWNFIHSYTVPQVARLLRDTAQYANLKLLTRTRRGPKKPRRTPNCKNIRHLSTRRVLDEAC